MSRIVSYFILYSIHLVFSPCIASANSITVDSWLVGIGISSSNPIGDSFIGTPNPFQQSHSRIQGNSATMATYDFSWNQQARFFVESTLAAETADNRIVRSSASGKVDFTTESEIMLIANGRFDRSLPVDQMSVRFNFAIFDLIEMQGVDGVGFAHNTISGIGPGTFQINDEQIVLEPGSYRLIYLMDVDAHPSSAGNIGTVDAFIEFRLIPEPTSLVMLLLFGVPFFGAWRRDRIGVYRNA